MCFFVSNSYDKLNLKRMIKLKKIYPNIPIGLSDHTLGIHTSLAAVSLGANIIEKAFYLIKKMEGTRYTNFYLTKVT